MRSGSGSCLDRTEVATTSAAVMATVTAVVENMGAAVARSTAQANNVPWGMVQNPDCANCTFAHSACVLPSRPEQSKPIAHLAHRAP